MTAVVAVKATAEVPITFPTRRVVAALVLSRRRGRGVEKGMRKLLVLGGMARAVPGETNEDEMVA